LRRKIVSVVEKYFFVLIRSDPPKCCKCGTIMDYIREFDIKLDKEYYYAGENINGVVVLDTVENFKLRSNNSTPQKPLTHLFVF
jgi:hypothetical protein